ncbi:MAG TPA: DUF6084 family protein [Candidatus Sulfotelmatobacter sp.]|nr:DUF6084 family protein [Candidatus Sulfotelmatobacter sp.]
MPQLTFKVTGVRAITRGLAPLLQFRVGITNATGEAILSILLHAQIQIRCARRGYNGHEKENLIELFGTPAEWGRTLRNCPWTSTNTVVGNFESETEAVLAVPCTYDVTLTTTKYFYGLESGEIPLLFLLSGTVFYSPGNGRIQTQPISWNTEVEYRMPLSVWKRLMEEHFPNCGWLRLRRDVFDRLYAIKRENADQSWEQTIERLLSQQKVLDADTVAAAA